MNERSENVARTSNERLLELVGELDHYAETEGYERGYPGGLYSGQRQRARAELEAGIRALTSHETVEVAVDARRYRRLQILGCAVMGTPQLEHGTVSRFSNLDAILDADIAAHPSRGEYAQKASEPRPCPIPEADGFDIQGKEIGPGIWGVGKANWHPESGDWRGLADINGSLCVVTLKVTPSSEGAGE